MSAHMFIVNVEAVVHRCGRFPMIERGAAESHGGGWLSFPGGSVEWDGEARDVLEVAGPWHHVENKVFAIDELHVLDVVLLARSDAGDPFIATPEEVAAIAWMTAGEILADPCIQPWTRDSLARCQLLLDTLGW